jgi:ElaB/YqjD/DUF883 family membrane-anchored ribosome-binding protein
MSDLAYQRFMASYMLTSEEQLPENRQDIIDTTEDVLQAHGIECDNRIKDLPQEKLQEILEEVRRLRDKKKTRRKQLQQEERKEEGQRGEEEGEEEQQVTA